MSASIRYTQPNYLGPMPQNSNSNSNSGWSAASIAGFVILVIIPCFIIIQYIIYRVNKYYNNKIINDWWNYRGGSKYSKCFNVDLINSYSSNKLLYGINTFFESEQDSQLKYVDIKFLDDNVIDHIFVQSASGSLNKDNSYNFLWPRHMCQSILFEKGEDYLYDKYLNSGGKGYPEDLDTDWQSLVSKWCGPDSKPSWIPMPNTKNVKILKIGVPSKIEWFDTDKHPDNIFARYKIQYDSPLVYSLCNNNYTMTADGKNFDRSAVLSLIGLKPGGGLVGGGDGGWIGFLLSLGSDDNPSDFAYTDTTIASDDSNDGDSGSGGKKCTGQDWLSAGVSGVTTGASMALMIALAPETGGLSVVIGGLFFGSISTIGAAAGNGCL